MNNDTKLNLSSHILPTSATMVGVCMTVISIIKFFAAGKATVVADKLLAFDNVLFLLSTLFSYLSMRSETVTGRLEKIADVTFLLGLTVMVGTSFILAFELA